MNYLAHSIRFLDDPHRMAGACLPDWLRVIDRRARVTPAALARVAPADDIEQRLHDGVQAHHHDDLRFHSHAHFEQLSADAVQRLRTLSPDPRFRASTIGHVLVEMLLDAALLERVPGCGAQFYDALSRVDADRVEAFAAVRTQRSLPYLQPLLERFRSARFVLGYSSDAGVERAMNGVLTRTGLPALPAGFRDVVAWARPGVAAGLDHLVEARVITLP